jgi:hypothetical protein
MILTQAVTYKTIEKKLQLLNLEMLNSALEIYISCHEYIMTMNIQLLKFPLLVTIKYYNIPSSSAQYILKMYIVGLTRRPAGVIYNINQPILFCIKIIYMTITES